MTYRHFTAALSAALFLALPVAAQQHHPQQHQPQPHQPANHDHQQNKQQDKQHGRHHVRQPEERPAPAAPAASPYAGEQARAIKSLAESDIAGLLAGAGAGFAKAAELNGYPGPAHVIELREQLDLSPTQLQASQALMAAHQARARALGHALVEAERRLDGLFADRRAQADTVEAVTAEVGRISARLRAEHLTTHLQQTALLRPAQVQAYNALRGYGTVPSTARGSHGGH